MNELKQIRLSMGLTQEVFARIIGVKRSRYSMVEAGLRGIPDVWFDSIRLHQQKAETIQNKESTELSFDCNKEKLEVYLNALKEDARNRTFLKVKTFRLQKMQSDYSKNKLAYEIICQEMQIFQPTSTHFIELEKKKNRLEKKIRETLPCHQQRLALEINIATQNIQLYESYLEQLKSDIPENEIKNKMIVRNPTSS